MLPDHVVPVNYKLFFSPDLVGFRYDGNVIIKLRVLKHTKRIILNSKELKIKNVHLRTNGIILHPKFKEHKEDETLILDFDRIIEPSISELSIDFSGDLGEDLSGFYRSKYIQNGRTKYLATTQFEAPYARKAFPCFDEPNKKATFDLTLLVDKNHKAVSNMPEEMQELRGRKKLIRFQRTPTMSTYLLYIGVGDFEFLHDKYRDVRLRVVTVPGKSKEGQFALDLTKKFLKYFEDYSHVPYPLPKLDLLAIPDFAAGAMENWGAITFREVLLLFDEKKTSTRIKKRIAEVIAHELWHQWSGDLVTMKWWDDLWLNESFATYMAFKAVAHYFPKWRMWEDFVDTETIRAFSADMLRSTHPIAVHVKTPNEVEEIFDEISYGKGGSVLRMIDSYLGEENFRRGVSEYLKKYAYKNASASDLWNCLGSIKPIMESWVKQPGFPLVELTKKDSKVSMYQKRFNHTTSQTWLVPLVMKGHNVVKHVLAKSRDKINLSGVVKANFGQEGFYRVKYDKDNLKGLATLVSKKELPVLDRWGIQNDLFSLALIGEISIDNYLEFLKSYENEDSYFVLSDIYESIYHIHYLFLGTPLWGKIQEKLKTHISKPFYKSHKKLGFKPKKNEDFNTALMRPLAISYLAFVGDEGVIDKCMKSVNKILPPDIEGAVYGVSASYGDEKMHANLENKYVKEKVVERKVKLLSSLYKFKNEKLLEKSLNFALSGKVRIQDLRTVFSLVGSNPYYRPFFLNWVKHNWDKIEKYKSTHYVFLEFLEALILLQTDKTKLGEISKMLKAKRVKYEKTKANSFEKAGINYNFMKRNAGVLEKYFSR